uniref:Putative structural protein n=1 Tax=viral metagenome TaxID=1070528 RepID=A0A6M3KP93_9ZZZZ
MTTSGSIDFNNTRNEIIHDAFFKLNVYGADEVVSAEDSQYASRVLNRMIKSWQAQELHLWKKQTAYLFIQNGQYEYSLKSTSTDHATLSYVETTFSADEAIGQTTLTVTSSSGMTAGDYIGLENEDGYLQWSTIDSITDATTIVVDDALTTACEDGAKIYAYTTKLTEPFNVYSAVRESEDGIDTPMNYLSYEGYFVLPNKLSSGTPVSYTYDRQLYDGKIRIWPVPNNVDYIMKLALALKIEDFDSATNTPDFPQEWLDAIVCNLALKLAPDYGKAAGDNYQVIMSQSQDALLIASQFDSEQGSLYISPDYIGSDHY